MGSVVVGECGDLQGGGRTLFEPYFRWRQEVILALKGLHAPDGLQFEVVVVCGVLD